MSWLILRHRPVRAGVLGALSAATLVAVGLSAPPASAAQPLCQGEPATIVGTESADDLHGTSGRDIIVGLGSLPTSLPEPRRARERTGSSASRTSPARSSPTS